LFADRSKNESIEKSLNFSYFMPENPIILEIDFRDVIVSILCMKVNVLFSK